MTKSLGIDAVDVDMCNRIKRSRRFSDDSDKTLTTQEREDFLPEDLMSKLEPFIGDAEGRITVSGALSSSHEFCKAEAFVSISVACNNNMDDILQVHEILKPTVQGLVFDDHLEMSHLRDNVLPPDRRLHLDVSSPEKETRTPPKKQGAPPKRTAKVTSGGKKARPLMRR